MVRLDLKREPYWLDLGHGVRVQVRPCTSALMMAARAGLPQDGDPAERAAALIVLLARAAVMDWDGVGDADGEPLAVSPDAVSALLDLWPMAEAFERLYLGPALLLDAEKNG